MAPVAIHKARLIAAPPAVLQVLDPTAGAFLAGLPAPDFVNTADTKALWAVVGTESGEGTADGTTYVVSAEAYKRVKAHRFS